MHCYTQPEQIAALAELVQQLTEVVKLLGVRIKQLEKRKKM
jgi:hypothetical protein